MYFGLSEDQVFFQDNVRKFLEDQAPLDAIRKIAEGNDSSSKDELYQGLKCYLRPILYFFKIISAPFNL